MDNENKTLDSTTQKKDETFVGVPTNDLDKKAKTSVTLGIIGLFAWIIPIIGLPIQVYGLTCAVKGLKSSKSNLATAGLVLTIIGLVLSIANAAIGAYLGATGQHSLIQ